MNAEDWDARYAAAPSVWGGEPNRWVAAEVGDLPPGRALDLACGEGRNAVWLAARGWDVTAVDFSAVALDKGRAAAGKRSVHWVLADVTEWTTEQRFELVLLVYLHLPPSQRDAVLDRAVAAVAPGGHLVVVAHDLANLTEGHGGPQDAEVLPTADEVRARLGSLAVRRAGTVEREVDGAPRPAIDLLVHAVAT